MKYKYLIEEREDIRILRLDRIESILPTLDIIRLKEVINSIADNMLDDGFEYSDVKEYIKTHLTEILGK
jgi:hypothetical protein